MPILNRFSSLTEIELLPGEGLKVTLSSEDQGVVLWISQLELPTGDGALGLCCEGALYRRGKERYVLAQKDLPGEITFLTVPSDVRSKVRLEIVE